MYGIQSGLENTLPLLLWGGSIIIIRFVFVIVASMSLLNQRLLYILFVFIFVLLEMQIILISVRHIQRATGLERVRVRNRIKENKCLNAHN